MLNDLFSLTPVAAAIYAATRGASLKRNIVDIQQYRTNHYQEWTEFAEVIN